MLCLRQADRELLPTRAREWSLRRFGAELWPVVARRGKAIDRRLVALMVDRYEELEGEPVDALLAGGAEADLVVIGSRGLHGVRSRGSVAERVAHQAPCSTLIVGGSLVRADCRPQRCVSSGSRSHP